MAITLDLSADHEIYDNHELIRYQSARRKLGDTFAVSGEEMFFKAKRRPLNNRELAASFGAYVAGDLVWLLWQKENLGDFAPAPWDRVLDGNDVEYTVLSSSLSKFRNTWRLTCRDLKIAHNLRDFVTFESAAVSDDAVASTLREWEPAKTLTDLACRVQPESQEIVEDAGVIGGERRYTIYLSRQLDLPNLREWRATWNDPANGLRPTILEFDRYTFTDQVGELPRLDARVSI